MLPSNRRSALRPRHLDSVPLRRLLLLALALPIACRASPEVRLDEIRALQGAGAYQESLDPLRDLLADRPDHPEANYRLGLALFRSGRPSQAVWPLHKAAESEEFARDAGLLLASDLLLTRNFEEAIAAAEKVLAAHPENEAALRVRGRASLSLSKASDALDDADRLLALDPDSFDGLFVRAGSLVALDRLEEAEDAFERLEEVGARQGPPVASRACLARASFYGRARADADRALSQSRDCLERHPSDTAGVALAVRLHDELGRPEEGTELMRGALAARPHALSLRVALAGRLLTAGLTEEALQLAEEGAERSAGAEGWVALANVRRAVGDLEGAHEAFQEALGLDARNEPLRFLVADLLVDLGRLEEAEGMARESSEPIYRDIILGRVALERGEPGQALDRLDRALGRWPNNEGARMLAARAAFELGRVDQAMSHLREAARMSFGQSDAGLLLARLFLVQGDARSAVAFAERHLRRRQAATALAELTDDPKTLATEGLAKRPSLDPEGYLIAARAYARLGDHEAARRKLEELRQREPYRALALAELSRLTEQTEGTDAAIRILEEPQLDLSDARNEAVLRQLVEFWFQTDRGDRARTLVAGLTEKRPEAAQLHALHGAILLQLGAVRAARAALDRASALDPNHPGTLAARGALARMEGNAPGAVELLDRAAALEPGNPAHAYGAAQALFDAGRSDEAERRLRTLVLSHPEHAAASNDLAWLLAQRGEQLDLAQELAARAARIRQDPQVLDTVGFVKFQRGELQDARDTFRRILEEHPEYATARYHLALALVASGDAKGAREALRAALDSGPFPEAEAARVELARLEKEAGN